MLDYLLGLYEELLGKSMKFMFPWNGFNRPRPCKEEEKEDTLNLICTKIMFPEEHLVWSSIPNFFETG
jgi:hypothetical protein